MDDFEFDEGRLLSTSLTSSENEDLSLRPKRLDEYIGQAKVKENMKICTKFNSELLGSQDRMGNLKTIIVLTCRLK